MQGGIFSNRYLLTRTGPVAAIVDLDSCSTNLVPLGFNAHSFVQNPRHPERVWAMGMLAWAGGVAGAAKEDKIYGAEIDIRERKVLQNLLLPEGEGFAGHGFFTLNGDVLFIPRMDAKKGVNFLTGYDTSGSRKIVADYPLGPGVTHDAQLLANGNAMVTCSGIIGADFTARVKKDELIEIDIGSGKIVRRWAFDDDRQEINHFALLRDGTLLAVSNGSEGHVPGKAYIGRHDADVLPEIPFGGAVKPGRPGELLSIATNETQDRAAVTDVSGEPNDRRVLFIDIKRRAFIKEINHDSTGMAFDKKSGYFIGSSKDILIVDGNGNKITSKEAKRFANLGGFDGPHSLLAKIPQVS
jgi:hypothetical protein